MKKRKHHYVWRHHLKAWLTDDKMFCSRNGKIFPVSKELDGIANERDFYQINELNQSDIQFIYDFAIRVSSNSLQDVHQNTIEYFISVIQTKKYLESLGMEKQEKAEKIDELIHNWEEDFYSEVENESQKYLQNILNNDLSFYDCPSERIAFLCFLCLQYFRTKSMKSRVLENISSDIPLEKRQSFNKTYNIITHMVSYNLAFNLAKNQKFKIVLLRNNTKVSFITGDQPVINVLAASIENSKKVNALELYYPISPFLAILITDREIYKDISEYIIDKDVQIEGYNLLIFEESYEQLYSNSKPILEQYLLSKKRSK